MPELLKTKFFIPGPAPGCVDRPRLAVRLDEVLARPLTLVSAPPGFGKTTLLSGWARQIGAGGGNTVLWLGLDPADNDPARFWTYAAAALRPWFHAAGSLAETRLERLLNLLEASLTPSFPAVLDALVNEAAGLAGEGAAGRALLFLDDYHVITQPLIHEGLTYLVEHLPPALRLVIATRADPPLPLARLRARGQLHEIRATELRFRSDEAGDLLRRLTGLDLAVETLTALENSTEGWAAGLQMAALALAGQAAGEKLTVDLAREFVAGFSGKHHFILDYLAEEVFNRQPPEIQAFLLDSAVLDRFCADLLEEVRGEGEAGCGNMLFGNSVTRDSGVEAPDCINPNNELPPPDPPPHRPPSSAILSHLLRSNLFLVPLDEERVWFRYHHLFAGLLRVRLKQEDPGRIPGLHHSAARWFEQQGLIEEAVHHTLAARDWEAAARLMEDHVERYLERGQLATVTNWVQALPPGTAERRPSLSVRLVWTLGFANQLSEAAALIPPALNALDQGAVSDPLEAARLRANLLLVQAFSRIASGDPAQAIEITETIRSLLHAVGSWEHGWFHWVRGYALRALANLDAAEEAFREAVRCADADAPSSAAGWHRMVFLNDLAIIEEMRGHLLRSELLLREAARLGQKRAHGYLSRVEAGLGQLLLQQNRVDEALEHARTAVEWSAWWPSANHRILALLVLAQVQIAQGSLDEAEQTLRQAAVERERTPVLATNASLYESVQAQLWQAQGNLDSLRRWAYERGASAALDEPVSGASEIWMLALARARLALDDSGGTLDVLAPVEESARAAGRTPTLIATLVIQAAALYRQAGGRPVPEAAGRLAESLRLAGGEGYARVYLEAGQPVRALLTGMREQPAVKEAARRVLALFDVERRQDQPSTAPGQPAAPPAAAGAGLVEPLTARELEVLALLGQGLSNRAMAERLYVSEGTVKTHVHNLIAKLDAQSRTQVIARARELGLL